MYYKIIFFLAIFHEIFGIIYTRLRHIFGIKTWQKHITCLGRLTSKNYMNCRTLNDFSKYLQNLHPKKASSNILSNKCESNPQLDKYIKKPKFSRDQYDYNVERSGYSARKLVCEEKTESHERSNTDYRIVNCTDVPGTLNLFLFNYINFI